MTYIPAALGFAVLKVCSAAKNTPVRRYSVIAGRLMQDFYAVFVGNGVDITLLRAAGRLCRVSDITRKQSAETFQINPLCMV